MTSITRALRRKGNSLNIYLDETEEITAKLEELLPTMKKAADICLENEKVDPEACELSLSFVSAEEIHALNKEYRDVDRKTDVLSFPQFNNTDEINENIEMFDEVSIGDVVICVDVAEDQAKEYGHSFERELVYLFVHSVLHLLGYDHMKEEEKAVMREREEAVMSELGIAR